jgi:hypothetical protein
MSYERRSRSAVIAVAASLLFFRGIGCRAQQNQSQPPPPQDHSCTVQAAGVFALPHGEDGQNFDKLGWGFQAGGGFALHHQDDPDRGWRFFLTSSFMFQKFKANANALNLAKQENPIVLKSATSAHGGFSAVTVDLIPRFTWTRRNSIYFAGGFGWLRRGIDFNNKNPGTLLQSNAISLDRLASNSGVFDAAAGYNRGMSKNGGLILFLEGRVYRGLTVNGGNTLVPISVGVRW